MEQSQKKEGLRGLLNASPRTRSFIADPRNAGIAQDSVEHFARIERYIEDQKATGVLSSLPHNSVRLFAGLVSTVGVASNAAQDHLYGESVSHLDQSRRRANTEAGNDIRRWNARHNAYVAGTEWQDVKDRPLSALLPFIVETGIASTPDMAAALANLPVYVAARTGDLGSTRAQNDKRSHATVEDLVSVLPASVGSALLERFGARGFLGLSDDVARASDLPRAVGVAALKEAATEAGQESLESAAETAFTEKGFNLAETLDRAAAGAVGGGGFGGGIRAGTGSLQLLRSDTVAAAEREQAEADRQIFDDLRKLVEETPAFGRRPESVRTFLEQATEGQTVLLDNEGLTSLYQSDPDTRTVLLEQLALTEEQIQAAFDGHDVEVDAARLLTCLLYTSPSPRDQRGSRMPSSA